MLSAQEHYLKNLYEQRQHQIFIDTVENHTLLLSLVQLHQKKAPPLLFAGKFPSFLLLKPESLRELLRQNHVADEMTNYCVKFQRVFQEQFQDPAIRKTFFYYQEDLLDFAAAPQALGHRTDRADRKPVLFPGRPPGAAGESAELLWGGFPRRSHCIQGKRHCA
mgnify:CR=1 FL=1